MLYLQKLICTHMVKEYPALNMFTGVRCESYVQPFQSSPNFFKNVSLESVLIL